MFKKYEQLDAIAQQCGEDVLYGTLMAVQNCTPRWREDPELKAVTLKIADRLNSKGWCVELGMDDSLRRFSVQPPPESCDTALTDHLISTGRRKAGVVKVGNFYIAERRLPGTTE